MLAVMLQAKVAGRWEDAALLEFPEPERGAQGSCHLEYDLDYLTRWMSSESPLAAVSLHLPLAFGPSCLRRWPAYLDDLRPLGGARAWWVRRLGLAGEPADDFTLLAKGTIAPVGNLRVKEAVPPKTGAPLRFPRQAVIDREHDFLEMAAEQGAQVGGATGAGGEAPKLLLRVSDDDEVWIDTWQDDDATPDHAYLVKFARGQKTPRDQVVLRSEAVYTRALAELGVATAPIEGLALEEGEHGPSLWLPRFDVVRRRGAEVRLGLESAYSLVGARPGAFLKHQDVLTALRRVVPAASWRDVLVEYLRRDLLNLVFGNSDNHGRNLAVLKTEDTVELAPVYDFAPMKMDPEGIIRTTRWERFEQGGSVDWPGLLASFGPDEERLRSALEELAEKLRDLPDRLVALGLPDETLAFPALDLRGTERKLRAWGLLA